MASILCRAGRKDRRPQGRVRLPSEDHAAAGIVMDVGGMLSHGSIVAREFGIPAVVNVGSAMRSIATGQIVRVDGDRGEVTVLEPEEE